MSKKKKQTYKPLTQWQEAGAISRALKGVSQQKIAKALGVSKYRVSKVLKAKGVGKRRKDTGDTFWGSVKAVQEATGYTWKRSRKTVYHAPKWGKKRAERMGKTYKRWEDFYKEAEAEALTAEEKKQKYEEESDEYYFDTPL